jgi:hypothetical protein
MTATARNPRHGRHGCYVGSKRSIDAVKKTILRRALEGDIASAELYLRLAGHLPGEEGADAGA